jgi:CheY-like chemotaxis protein
MNTVICAACGLNAMQTHKALNSAFLRIAYRGDSYDGNEALRILKDRTNPVDTRFIDLNLPGMDGMELMRHMSQQTRAPSIMLASALAPSLIFQSKPCRKHRASIYQG